MLFAFATTVYSKIKQRNGGNKGICRLRIFTSLKYVILFGWKYLFLSETHRRSDDVDRSNVVFSYVDGRLSLCCDERIILSFFTSKLYTVWERYGLLGLDAVVAVWLAVLSWPRGYEWLAICCWGVPFPEYAGKFIQRRALRNLTESALRSS